jgi:hypothetical protein
MLVFQTEPSGVVRQLVTRRDEVVALLTPPTSSLPPPGRSSWTQPPDTLIPHPHTEYKYIYLLSEIGKKMMTVATVME